ncbi:MAG: nitronate monooxygenase, partial [Gammaproteobacteria bacterium]|nr:nitronate monooxygenase [Gammaproteobacteria bacterium]
RWMLGGNTTKHWMRMYYALKSIWQLKRSSLDETGTRDYWQAGKSVSGIDRVESCESIMKQLLSPEA